MQTISARLGVIAFAAAVLFASPPAAEAFGLSLGPFHLGLPFGGYHRHRPHAPDAVARTDQESPLPTKPDSLELALSGRPTLLYPALVWTSFNDAIFWPRADQLWPFGYRKIFDQAFGKYPEDQSAELCRYRDTSGEVTMRLARDLGPSDSQKPLMEKLGAAAGQANGYLFKSCPKQIPLQPVARLQLMEGQIDAMIMALEIVRPPLEQFERSLDEKQRARWDAAAPVANGEAAACNSETEGANWPLSQLEQAAQPTAVQRKSLIYVEDAFKRAASGLAAAGCEGAVPRSASGRLTMIEDRLDATWRAVQTIEVALANFEKDLSDEQKARINALKSASAR
jgi:hypothetical protein